MNSNYERLLTGLTLETRQRLYLQRFTHMDNTESVTVSIAVGPKALACASRAVKILRNGGSYGKLRVIEQPPLEQCFKQKYQQRQAVIQKNKDKDERWKKLNLVKAEPQRQPPQAPSATSWQQKQPVQYQHQHQHVKAEESRLVPSINQGYAEQYASTNATHQVTSTRPAAQGEAGAPSSSYRPQGFQQQTADFTENAQVSGNGYERNSGFNSSNSAYRMDANTTRTYAQPPPAPLHQPSYANQSSAISSAYNSSHNSHSASLTSRGNENTFQGANSGGMSSGSASSFSDSSKNSKYFHENSNISASTTNASKMQKLAEAGWDDFDFREMVNSKAATPVPRQVQQRQRPAGNKSPVRNPLNDLIRRERQLEASTATTFDWAQVYEINREVYGHRTFRPGQVSAIYHSLMGKDVFVLMPTGGGKSLCYQVPSLVRGVGISIVVSPLVSLVHDQVQGLRACGVDAACLLGSGRQTQEEYSNVMSGVHQGRIRLLYVTPEKLAQSGSFMSTLERLYQRQQLGRFVIDEAHCVSNWGHDFRSDYLKLSVLKQSFPQVPMMALTATANRRVIQDIIKVLGLRSPETITLSFNRKNLHYQIRPKKSFKTTIENIVSYVKSRSRDCGIVYCLSRKETESVAQALQAVLGSDAVSFYHAGIEDPEERQLAQDKWSKGRAKVIVATIAFGMGINKPNVRYVIHFSMPKSITNFYQESGRGGRDGLVANSVLYYSYGDKLKIERMLKRGNTADGSRYGKRFQSHTIQLQMDNLRRMTAFCMNQIDCRRKLILEYFGETFDQCLCNKTCDNCKDGTARVRSDVTEEAKLILALVQDCQAKRQNLTMTTMVGILRGTSVKGAFAAIDNYSSARSLTSWSKDDLSRLTHQLVLDGHLEEVEVTNRAGFPTVYIQVGHKPIRQPIMIVTLKAAKRTRKVRKKEALDLVDPPLEKRRKSVPGRGGSSRGVVEETLLLSLTQYTGDYAERNNIQSWNVFDEKTVTEMARRIPRTLEELKDINGVAKRKIDTHGAQILEIINSSLQKLRATDLPPFQFRQDIQALPDEEDQDFIIIE